MMWKLLATIANLATNLSIQHLPSGYLSHSHGKSPFVIGKPSISMGHGFHGYFSHNQRVIGSESFMMFDVMFASTTDPSLDHDGDFGKAIVIAAIFSSLDRVTNDQWHPKMVGLLGSYCVL